MPRTLDLDTWSRREHFHFFRVFDNPFWNVTVEVDVSALHGQCQRRGLSFTVACYFLALRALNEVEALRYRIRQDPDSGTPAVVVHEIIHGGAIVMRPDDSFGFCYFSYRPEFAAFAPATRAALDAARSEPGLDPRTDRDDLVHFSVLPWLAFTSFAHARCLGTGDSVPKIVIGKHREVQGRRVMPLSLEVHHALADGLHVGRFYEGLQGALDDAGDLVA